MRIGQIEAFIVTAKCGSLTRASEILHSTPAAMSQRIKQFENLLGDQVFVRTNQGMQLSEYGFKIYDQALEVVESARLLRSSKSIAITSSIDRPVIVGISTAFNLECVKRLAIACIIKNTQIHIRLIGDDAIDRALQDGTINIGISYSSNNRENMISRYFGSSKFTLVGAGCDLSSPSVNVISPNIPDLINYFSSECSYKNPCNIIHFDSYEMSIDCILSTNSVAVVDELSAKMFKKVYAELVGYEKNIMIPFYIKFGRESIRLANFAAEHIRIDLILKEIKKEYDMADTQITRSNSLDQTASAPTDFIARVS